MDNRSASALITEVSSLRVNTEPVGEILYIKGAVISYEKRFCSVFLYIPLEIYFGKLKLRRFNNAAYTRMRIMTPI